MMFLNDLVFFKWISKMMETIDFVHMEHIALGEGTKANINCLIEIVYVELEPRGYEIHTFGLFGQSCS
jgi:hypothetical protein